MTFTDLGFYFNDKFISWKIVQTIYTFKIDLIVYDEIVLEISTNNQIYTFPESEENWFEFAKLITEKFNLDSFDWYFEIMKNAFQENRILLFDRNNKN